MELMPVDMLLSEANRSEAYVQVRRRVFRQLLESVLFERIVPAHAVVLGKESMFIFHGRDRNGEPVTYNGRGSRRLSFGRIRLGETPVMRISKEGSKEAHSFRTFLDEVVADAAGVDTVKLDAFAKELDGTLLNDTLAQYFRRITGLRLTGSFTELETAAMDGHPYHPCYKSRVGFTPEDQAAYGPEFGVDIHPLWLAVRRDEAVMAIEPGTDFEELWRRELGSELLSRFEAILAEKGETLSSCALLPVHPWQWREIAPALADERQDGRIVLLGPSADKYRPQQSLRTLANVTDSNKPYVKLSMSLLNTSSHRRIEPHYAAAAPLVSGWLQRVVNGDDYLRDEAKVILLREFAAVGYEPKEQVKADEAPESAARLEEGTLACIWRDSLERHLQAGEAAAPFNALAAIDVDGTPFIGQWVQRYGAERWLTGLFDACVLPVVHLLAAHGIALESHAQNMIFVHRDGMPSRAALKDFHEDVMFCRSFLSGEAAAACPDFAAVHPAFAGPGRFFEQEDTTPLRYLLLGALYWINLSELAMLFADRYGFDEHKFWTIAADRLEAHIQKFSHLALRFDRLDLFGPSTRLEQLTKKRLFQRSADAEAAAMMHEVPNPLHAVRNRIELEPISR